MRARSFPAGELIRTRLLRVLGGFRCTIIVPILTRVVTSFVSGDDPVEKKPKDLWMLAEVGVAAEAAEQKMVSESSFNVVPPSPSNEKAECLISRTYSRNSSFEITMPTFSREVSWGVDIVGGRGTCSLNCNCVLIFFNFNISFQIFRRELFPRFSRATERFPKGLPKSSQLVPLS